MQNCSGSSQHQYRSAMHAIAALMLRSPGVQPDASGQMPVVCSAGACGLLRGLVKGGLGGLSKQVGWRQQGLAALCALLQGRMPACREPDLADLGGGGAFGSTGSRFPRQKMFR
jgi:hypothetical protein